MSNRQIQAVDIHVGEKLKELRLLSNMSQADLAKTVNISFQQVQKYENGVNRISIGRLYEFSKLFKVSVDYFVDDFEASTRKKKSNDDNSIIALLSDRETAKLVNSYWQIENKQMRKTILDTIVKMSQAMD